MRGAKARDQADAREEPGGTRAAPIPHDHRLEAQLSDLAFSPLEHDFTADAPDRAGDTDSAVSTIKGA